MKMQSIYNKILLVLFSQLSMAQEYAQHLVVHLQVSFDDHADIGAPYRRMPGRDITVTLCGTSMNFVGEGTLSVDIPQLTSGSYFSNT